MAPDELSPSFTPPPANPIVTVPDTAPSGATVERGRYLVEQAGCADCHTPRAADGALAEGRELAGGGQRFEQPDGSVVVPPNLTPAGPLRASTDDQIAAAIREGRASDGHQLNPSMPYASAFYAYTDTDVAAVVAYLRSLPAVVNDLPANPAWSGSR